MSSPERPLSPHLLIYKPQLTSILSITHRATGVALTGGTLLLTWWIFAAATGPEYFGFVQGLAGSWLGILVLLGFSFSLFFHLCNGIRHLFWDVGYGFELDTLYRSGWAVVIAAIVLTALAWWFGLSVMAG